MSERGFAVETHAAEETEAIGAALWPFLSEGGVITLHGDLAAGKTCFVRGLATAAGVGEAVHSPTFTLVNQYETFPPIYHLDLYRLESPEQLYDLGWEDWQDQGGVIAIEWPERAEGLLPTRRVEILLSHLPPEARRVAVRNYGLLEGDWESALRGAMKR